MRLTTSTLLTADTATRRLRYRLVPYGEVSRPTSHGPIVVPRGVLTAGFARSYVNLEHDPDAVVGRLDVEDTPDCLIASVRVLPGPAGDAVLAKPPAGASFEVHEPVFDSDRVLTAGLLVGAALTGTPAFEGALLTASEVPDGEPADDPAPVEDPPVDTPEPQDPPTEVPPATLDPVAPEPEDHPVTETETETTTTTETETETTTPVATAPVLTAAARTRPATPAAAAARAVALRREGASVELLTAALSDITATGTGTGQGGDWLGVLWDNEPRDRPFVESVTRGTLNGIKPPSGWRWNAPPVVAAYSGDKAAVPSNAVTLTAIAGALTRLAGAHDIDRAIFDLGETDLIEGYWSEMADSYAALSEDLMSDTLVAGATDGTVAAGITVASSAVEVIVAAAMAVAPVARPTFVGVSADLFGEFLTNPESAALEFLGGSAGFDGNGSFGGLRVFLGSTLAARTAVAGNVKAARFHELPGSPIRAQAVNMPNGGIDVGVFGYASAFVTKPTAVVKIIRPAV